MQTVKKTNCFALVVLIVTISLGSVSCVKGSATKKSQQTEAKPRETPVAFQPTIQNGGKRCEPLWYTGQPGDEHDNADHRCFVLQEKLINGALDGNLNQIREALREGAHVEGTAYNKFPALHSAAMKGRADAVTLLLNNGANVNRVVDFENSVLNMAASEGHTDVVRVLLDRGADVCYKSASGTAGDIARARGHKELTELLRAAEMAKCK
jgi:Ankyrin repeats (3 copies)